MKDENKETGPRRSASKLFGNGARMWIRMQTAYDTRHAKREVDVSNIPTLEAASAS